MAQKTYVVGKVRPSYEGKHNTRRVYSVMSVVESDGVCYEAKRDVPIGIEITNTDYWQETVDWNVTTKRLENEIAAEKTRLDQFLLSGVTASGDGEVADIRVGVDGTVYKTAGTSVRTQILNIDTKVNEYKTKVSDLDTSVKKLDDQCQDAFEDLETMKSQIADLSYKPISISTFTNDTNSVEMGTVITSVLLSWSINKTPKILTLDGKNLSVSINNTILSNQNITTDTTYTLKAVDERNGESTKTTKISFINGIYCGVNAVTPDGVDNAFITAMTKTLSATRKSEFKITAFENYYIYFALPTRFGKPTFNVNGFDGGFQKIKTLQFTNPSNYTESYDVWKSDNPGLGETVVKLS